MNSNVAAASTNIAAVVRHIVGARLFAEHPAMTSSLSRPGGWSAGASDRSRPALHLLLSVLFYSKRRRAFCDQAFI
jgi:hypothetical protein